MKKFLRVSDVAEQLNVSASAVRKYANAGEISYTLTPNGQRVFSQKAIDAFLGKDEPIIPVFYIRSSNGDQKMLASQQEALTIKYGAPNHVYSDKGSGLNENRKGLQQLLKDAQNRKFTRVYITQKDRLTRFGYQYIETLLKMCDIEIISMGDEGTKTLHDELLQDFMSLVASFSGKFYRIRGYEQKQKLLETARKTLDETH